MALCCVADGMLAVMGSNKLALCFFRPRAELDALFEHAWMAIDATGGDATDEPKREVRCRPP